MKYNQSKLNETKSKPVESDKPGTYWNMEYNPIMNTPQTNR